MSNLPTKRHNPIIAPRSIFAPLFEEFFNDEWFNDFLRPTWHERLGSCDFEKTADTYVVSVDVPGLTKDEIKVDVEDGIISISGERKPKEKKEETEYLAAERSFRRFKRTFRLPEDVDYEKTEAKVENGVLTMSFGRKKAEKSVKTIKIN
jgi:HSP20 family protein